MIIKDFVEYVKQTWKNRPDTSTPMSAERLNHMEDGIKGNSDAIKALADAVYDEILNDSEKIASLAALYSLKQEVDKKIASPATATVGQILEVEEVNEDGVPTKFKAVDNKGGGSADWDVNDENTDGYVKNRTHWKRILQTYELLCDEMVVEFTGELNTIAGIGTSNIVAGTVYTVYWNGTAYECTATSTYLGNGSLISAGDDTGEPFCFEYMTATGSYVMKSTSDAESVTIKVERPEKIEWNQMDPRYIPDMYYTENDLIELLPETTLVATMENDGVIITENVPVLKAGEKYIIKYDGVEYECIAVDITSIAGDAPAGSCVLGNLASLGLEDSGEPFTIMYGPFGGDMQRYAINIVPLEFLATEADTEFTLSIYKNDEIVHQIPEKFIPASASAGPVINITVNSITADTCTAVSDTTYEEAIALTDGQLQAAISFKYPNTSTTNHASVNFITRYETSDGISYIRFLVMNYSNAGLNYECRVDEWFWYGGTTLAGSRKYSLIPSPLNCDYEENMLLMLGDGTNYDTSDMYWRFPKSIVMLASDDNSKKFKLTVDSTGAIKATEIT